MSLKITDLLQSKKYQALYRLDGDTSFLAVAARLRDPTQKLVVKDKTFIVSGNASANGKKESRITLVFDGKFVRAPIGKGFTPKQTVAAIAGELPKGYVMSATKPAEKGGDVSFVIVRKDGADVGLFDNGKPVLKDRAQRMLESEAPLLISGGDILGLFGDKFER